MEVSLCKADLKDAVTIHEMKVKAFMPLLEKYQDFETSPTNETVERIVTQINQSFTDYFIIHSRYMMMQSHGNWVPSYKRKETVIYMKR